MVAERHKMDNPAQNAVLYATPDTRAALGAIGDNITAISGVDTLVVTRADVIVLKTPSQDLSQIDTAENPAAIIDWRKTNDNLRTLFNTAGYPADTLLETHLTELSAHIALKDISAQRFDFDQDGVKDLGFIIAPDIDTTPAEYVSILTGIPADRLTDIPGSAKDYLALVMYHESGHIPQPGGYGLSPLPFEIDADKTAMKQGRNIAPEVLEMLRDARIVGGMNHAGTIFGTIAAQMGMTSLGPGLSHETGFFLPADNGLPQMTPDAMAQNTHAMTMVNLTVNTVLATRVTAEIGQSLENGTYEETLEKYGMTATDALEMMGNPLKASRIGAIYGAMNPGASFSALQTLHEKGYLKNIEGADAYIGKIGDFYDKHVKNAADDPAYQEMKSWLTQIPDAPAPEIQSAMPGQEAKPGIAAPAPKN